MATGYLTIVNNFDAPIGLTAVTSNGGTFTNNTVSFLIVAWDDPEESDWHRARLRTQRIGTSNAGAATQFSSMLNGVVTDASNDIVTLSWTPPRRRPHHYTVYYQVAAAYAFNVSGIKIRPSSGTTQGLEIPGWATSAIFANSTAVTEQRWYPIKATSANAYYDIEGNHALDFPDAAAGVTVFPDGATVTVTSSPNLLHSGNEERTRVFATTTVSAQTYLRTTSHGPIKFANTSALGARSTIIVSLVTDFPLTFREKSGMSFGGKLVPLSYTTSADIPAITIQCTMGGLSISDVPPWVSASGADALAFLHKCRRHGIPLAFFYTAAGSEKFTGACYYGMIQTINELGYDHIQNNQRIEVTLKIDDMDYESQDLGNYGITVVSTASKTFTITGEYTSRFIAGTRIEVIGSTDNDRLYAVASSAVSTTNTVITVTAAPTSTTAGGIIRILDQP